MTDLTFCYLHMTKYDLQVLDTLETPDFIKGELHDEDLDIPPYLIPPNPEDSDSLPSRTHPSYPYGNPTNVKHPAARPKPTFDPASRALFEDMGYATGDVHGSLRWSDLALRELLPVDEVKEEAEKAAEARRMAAGSSNNPQQPPTQPAQPQGNPDIDEEEEEEEEEEQESDDLETEEEEEEDETGW